MSRITAQTLLSFAVACDQWLAFKCDETCNELSDVCCHNFTWACPDCGAARTTIGECMPDVKEFAEGRCDECFYDQHYPAAAVAGGGDDRGAPSAEAAR